MEDIQAVDLALSAEPSPGTPEALQVPTRQVGRGFMFALTAAAISLYILYAGIGALLLPFQIGLLAPGSKVAILSFFTSITVPFALFLSDKVLPKGSMPPFHLGAFLKNFWVNPRTYPDFGWAWLTRFVPFVGYFLGITYIFYYLEDVVKYPHALQGASTFSINAAVVSLLSTVLGGFLSDRLKRRKLFVIVGMCIMAIAMLLLALFHTWLAVVVAAAVLGFGLGAYLAVDVAIVTLVLPSAENRAKDMGIVNIANTLPHSLAPVLAGFILALTHSYSLLYIAAAIFVLLGIFTVMPIKAVR